MENGKNIDEDTAEKAGVTDSPMSTTLNMLAIETIINMRCNEKELLIFQNFQNKFRSYNCREKPFTYQYYI